MSENINTIANNANRLNAYKNNTKSNQEMRQRRHDVTVELRKNKKEEQMYKRRNIDDLIEPPSPLQESNGQSPQSLTIEEIVEGMYSSNPKKQFEATQAARKILSRERNPPIDLIISHGIVTPCVKFLECFDNPDLQFEATWTLTNLASGNAEQTKAVVNAGAIPKLVDLLNCPSLTVADQAVWALGNIAGDGPESRDLVLDYNVVDRLIELLQKEIPLTFVQNTVWFMSNLCRNKNPHPPFDKIRPMLPVLAQFLLHRDASVLADVCWALSYISDDDNEKIQAIVDTGCLPALIRLLDTDAPLIITPALRTVGNIVTGTDQQTDAVIEAGAIPMLNKLLSSSKSAIVKEATWTVSNIAAGHRGQIQSLIDAGIYQKILNVLETGDFRSQKEAAWVITNTTTSGTSQQMVHLLELQLLKPFCDLLEVKDLRIVKVVLNGLENLCQMFCQAGGIEYFCMAVEANGGLDKLENLQNHENDEIYKKAYKIIDTYFTGNDEEENPVAPKEVNGELEFAPNNVNSEQQEFKF